MTKGIKSLLMSFVFSMVLVVHVKAQANDVSTIAVKKTKDFSVNGLGDAASWKTTSFTKLNKKLTSSKKSKMNFIFKKMQVSI
jgi:hypothetical protein